ncbi:hypothetical protein EVC13_026 [Rhizobium phage RHph_I65]|nr:hypothetical protein EVC13_026 [Rhizobium phage RHph_I65]
MLGIGPVPNTGDFFKIPCRMKIVPENDPNDPGKWVHVAVRERRLTPKTNFNYLNSLVPGYFCVKIERL